MRLSDISNSVRLLSSLRASTLTICIYRVVDVPCIEVRCHFEQQVDRSQDEDEDEDEVNYSLHASK
jgi:hypothetical protein